MGQVSGAKWGEFEMTWIDNPLTVTLTKVHDAFEPLWVTVKKYVKNQLERTCIA